MRYSWLFPLLWLWSCSDTPEETVLNDRFFDVTVFLQDHFSADNTKVRNVQKLIWFGEEVDTMNIKDYDISEDLKNFDAVNINRISWYDKYSQDTFNLEGEQQIVYTSIDPKMKTKHMEVNLTGNKVTSIKAIIEYNSIISDTKKTMSFEVDTGYEIHSESKSKLIKSRDIKIEVNFVRS